MATLNTTEWFGLHDRGAIAPGRRADLIVCDDLRDFRPRLVYAGGRLVARDGQMCAAVMRVPFQAFRRGEQPRSTCAGTPSICASRRRGAAVRVIGALPNQLVTEERILPARVVDG
jgi:adenine deaminase